MNYRNKLLNEDLHLADFRFLARPVQKMILRERFDLIEKMVKEVLDAKRYAHSLETAKLARALAVKHGLDPKKAYLAGLLHDIAKPLPQAELAAYLACFDPEKLKTPPALWHSYVAVYYLKRYLNYYDQTVLRAIYHHTDGESKAPLSMIIYLADKCEITRGYYADYRALAFKDYRQAFKLLKQAVEQYVIDKEKNA